MISIDFVAEDKVAHVLGMSRACILLRGLDHTLLEVLELVARVAWSATEDGAVNIGGAGIRVNVDLEGGRRLRRVLGHGCGDWGFSKRCKD
jgi:hypothetical protein